MPVSSYPRVTVQGTGTAQNTQNGSALMVVNPSTGKYEAATAATFGGGGGGGDATAANQTTQISEAQQSNLSLSNIDNSTNSLNTTTQFGTNTGILSDILEYQILTTSYVSLSSYGCKYVTLINLSTNAKFEYRLNVAIPFDMILEAGYSVRINIANSSTLQIRQTTGEAQTAQIIITQ